MDRLAPGGVGMFRIVRLDPGARAPSYIHGRVLARLLRSSTMVVSEKITPTSASDDGDDLGQAHVQDDDHGRPKHG